MTSSAECHVGHRQHSGGCGDIGFSARNPNLSAPAARFEEYRSAIEEAGIAFRDMLITPGLYIYRSGHEAAEQLLDLADRQERFFAPTPT